MNVPFLNLAAQYASLKNEILPAVEKVLVGGHYILGPNDDIVRFEFIQKHNKETGPALIGIEVKTKDDFQALIDRMNDHKLNYTVVNQNENLFEYLV